MRTILKQFYFGNLTPSERKMPPSSDLHRAVNRISQCERQLMEQLNEGEQTLLGEISNFYGYFPFSDTMLHTINGFLAAAIGFSVVDLLNNHAKGVKLTPVFVALVSFCFSMTVGVLWEFFEFGGDQLARLDMQKDWLIQSISSVALDPAHDNNAITIDGIAYTVLYDSEGNELLTIEGGYLDIGIIDTMKDLQVNMIGAIVFSVFGYLYIHRRDKFSFAGNFLIVQETDSSQPE